MEDLKAIIPFLGRTEDLGAWNGGHGIDWESFQCIMGQVEQAAYWFNVLMPTFVEVNGMVLRRNLSSAHSVESNANYAPLQASQVEYLINHFHISDLFSNDPHQNEYDPAVYDYIAHMIAKGWRCQLHSLFPEKEFDVGIGEDGGELAVYAVTVRDST